MPRIFSALLLWLLVSAPAWADALEIRDAWVREGPPGMQMLAGFMTLYNPGSKTHILARVDSPDFQAVEMHETRIDAEGVAHMLPLQQVRIPAGGTVRFAPGGKHLMLIGPRRPLRAGEKVVLRLHLDNGLCLRVPFPVRRTPPDGSDPDT